MIRTQGILFSHASETTISGLVYGKFDSRTAAAEEARKSASRGGVRFLIMTRQEDGGWLDRQGRTPVEALRDGIANGFQEWQS